MQSHFSEQPFAALRPQSAPISLARLTEKAVSSVQDCNDSKLLFLKIAKFRTPFFEFCALFGVPRDGCFMGDKMKGTASPTNEFEDQEPYGGALQDISTSI